MATAFATRYQPGGTGIIPANSGKGILDYQIWDEPNVVENWPTGVSSSEYVGYLKAAIQESNQFSPVLPSSWEGFSPAQTSNGERDLSALLVQ